MTLLIRSNDSLLHSLTYAFVNVHHRIGILICTSVGAIITLGIAIVIYIILRIKTVITVGLIFLAIFTMVILSLSIIFTSTEYATLIVGFGRSLPRDSRCFVNLVRVIATLS